MRFGSPSCRATARGGGISAAGHDRPMHLDVDTLLFASISSRCSYLLVFIVAGLRQRSDGSLLHWGGSIALSMLGVATTAKSSTYPYLPIGSGTLTYAVYGTSIALCWSGMRRFKARPFTLPAFAFQAMLPGALYGAILLGGLAPSWALAGMFAALTVSMGRAVGEVWLQDGPVRLWSQYVVLTPLIAYLSMFVASFVLIFIDRAALDDPSNAYLSLIIDQFCSVLVYTGFLAISAERANARLQLLATVDPLTSLNNRYGLLTMTERWRAASDPRERPVCVVIVDIDHFKSINDSYGHEGGDAVLVAFAQRFRGVFKRRSDVVARWGGEEFLAVLHGTDLAPALRLAEQLRAATEDEPFRVGGTQARVTVSVGVAAVEASDQGLEGTIRRADAALYLAKNGGRNRVCS